MSRLNMGRYKPSKWTYPEPVKRPGAARGETLVALAVIVALGLMAFAEPILDLISAALR